MHIQRLLVRINQFKYDHVNDMDDQDKHRNRNHREEFLVIEHENHHSHHQQVQEVDLAVFEFFWFLADLTPCVLTQENVFAVVDSDQCDEESSYNANESSKVEKDTCCEDINVFVTDKDLQQQSSQDLHYRPHHNMTHQVVRSKTDFERQSESLLQ